jgi:hypothetical protein
MSYSITIGGHTRNEHNARIKEIAEDAWAKVAALHGTDETPPSLSGWSGDQTGSITLLTPQPVEAAAIGERDDDPGESTQTQEGTTT